MLASAIAHSEAFSIAGGGDTFLAAIAKFHIAEDVGYIYLGGGAFLEFLEGKTLPAIQVLEERPLAVVQMDLHLTVLPTRCKPVFERAKI